MRQGKFLNLKTKFISEPGSYLHNADYFAFVELKDYACYCIADGIDTDEKGKRKSSSYSSYYRFFQKIRESSKNKLKQYMMTAHHALLTRQRNASGSKYGCGDQ